jgi:CRP-like cAMP-binding protein
MIDPFAELNGVAISAPMPKGSVIFQNCDPGSTVYLIRSGRIALVWTDANEVVPMDLHGPGRILGTASGLQWQLPRNSESHRGFGTWFRSL